MKLLWNVAMADVITDYEPVNGGKAFRVIQQVLESTDLETVLTQKNASVSVDSARLYKPQSIATG